MFDWDQCKCSVGSYQSSMASLSYAWIHNHILLFVSDYVSSQYQFRKQDLVDFPSAYSELHLELWDREKVSCIQGEVLVQGLGFHIYPIQIWECQNTSSISCFSFKQNPDPLHNTVTECQMWEHPALLLKPEPPHPACRFCLHLSGTLPFSTSVGNRTGNSLSIIGKPQPIDYR